MSSSRFKVERCDTYRQPQWIITLDADAILRDLESAVDQVVIDEEEPPVRISIIRRGKFGSGSGFDVPDKRTLFAFVEGYRFGSRSTAAKSASIVPVLHRLSSRPARRVGGSASRATSARLPRRSPCVLRSGSTLVMVQ